MILNSLPSSLISVPPYLLTRTRSPFLTSNGIFFPSSLVLPVPRAMTMPSWGFSLAVSGMMMPPFLVSFSSAGSTRRRSPRGLMFSAIVWFVWFGCLMVIKSRRLSGRENFQLPALINAVASGGLLLLVHNLGVNDRTFVLLALILRAGVALRLAPCLPFAGLGFRRCRFVKFGTHGLPRFVELLARRFDRARVAALQRFFHVRHGFLDLGLVVAGNLVGVVLQHF